MTLYNVRIPETLAAKIEEVVARRKKRGEATRSQVLRDLLRAGIEAEANTPPTR